MQRRVATHTGTLSERSAGSVSTGTMLPLAKTSSKNAPPMLQHASISLSRSTTDMDGIKQILNLSFPRCSCCKTGWYDVLGGDNDDDNEHKLAVSEAKRKRHRTRPSHRNLLPMPKCDCNTRLALPCLPSVVYSTDNSDPKEVLSQIKTCSFPNLAICKSCLEHRIAASKEVTVHDYHQGHIPNGQRDVRFTVELCCVQCKRKFSVRFLEKLLENEGAQKSSTAVARNRKQGKSDANWHDAVEATIKLVKWAKQDSRKERRRLRQRRMNEKLNRISTVGGNEQDLSKWDNLNGFTGGDGNCSSDECFSFSSESSEEDDELLWPVKGPRRQELTPGELLTELLQKDPKFRQEKEDEQYVKKFMEEQEMRVAKVEALDAQALEDESFVMKLIEQENEERRKAAEARIREDHEVAMRMQRELDRQKTISATVNTRSKSPILDAWKKSSASSEKSGMTKYRTPVSVDKVSKQRLTFQKQSADASISSSVLIEASLSGSQKRPACNLSEELSTFHPNSGCQKRPACNQSEDQSTSQINEAMVDEIVAMGFSSESAQRSLTLADGNIQRALDLLLPKSSDPTIQ